MPTSIVSSKGQTVIPKSVREHLGIVAGDRVEFIVDEHGEVKLARTGRIEFSQLRGLLHKPGIGRRSQEEMDQGIRKAVSQRS